MILAISFRKDKRNQGPGELYELYSYKYELQTFHNLSLGKSTKVPGRSVDRDTFSNYEFSVRVRPFRK